MLNVVLLTISMCDWLGGARCTMLILLGFTLFPTLLFARSLILHITFIYYCFFSSFSFGNGSNIQEKPLIYYNGSSHKHMKMKKKKYLEKKYPTTITKPKEDRDRKRERGKRMKIKMMTVQYSKYVGCIHNRLRQWIYCSALCTCVDEWIVGWGTFLGVIVRWGFFWKRFGFCSWFWENSSNFPPFHYPISFPLWILYRLT